MLKYKHTTDADLPQIKEWMDADATHAGVMKPEDFIQPVTDGTRNDHTQCIEVRDEKGIIFYLRFRSAIIVDTQFAPNPRGGIEGLTVSFSHVKQQLRVSRALKEALGYFSVSCKNLGYHAMFFNSVSDSLIGFFEKLGFKRLTDYFKADL